MFNQIREFRAWRIQRQHRNRRLARLMGIQLGKYSFEECLIAVSRQRFIPDSDIGHVARILHMRCDRGTMTLDYAIKLYAAE